MPYAHHLPPFTGPATPVAAPVVRPDVMSLKDYYNFRSNPSDNLLGNNFLCRKGILIIAGPSHVGKSALSAQQDALWALGHPALGIVPARPLKILTFQAENDAADMHKTTRGIFTSLDLCQSEIDQIGDSTRYITLRSVSGLAFLEALESELINQQGWPDIIRLDPLMAFIGDDPTNAKAVIAFMRGGLSSLIDRFNVGAICTHHTTKTQNMDTSKFSSHDFQYCMAGTADLTNLARSVIAINPLKDGKTFCFIAAKGKSKIGWPSPLKYFAHAANRIFWEDAAPPQETGKPGLTTRTATPDQLVALFGSDREIPKVELLLRCGPADIGQNIAREFIKQKVADGTLAQFEKPRSGARPEVWLRKVTKPSTPSVAGMPVGYPFLADLDDDIPF